MNHEQFNHLLGPVDPETRAILDEYGITADLYETKEDVVRELDEIANEYLLDDLAAAEAADLAEPDSAVRNQALHANAVKTKIYRLQQKLHELDPEYEPSIYQPMKLADWNPPRSASPQDFYKEFAYYFGDDAEGVAKAAELYVRYHPDEDMQQIIRTMGE